MNDELRALLSGYAAGTLTEEERDRLYSAALEDETVFAAMADEQALRDVLDHASARAELLAAVQDRPFSVTSSLRDWFERPKSKVLAGVGLALLVAIGVKQVQESRSRPETREIAQVIRPSAEAPVMPPPVRATEPPASAAAPVPREASREAKRTAPVEPEQRAAALRDSPVAATVPGPPAPLAAPPPPPSPASERSIPVLTWSVLRVDASGTAVPVERSHEFSPGEKARIRIESSAQGMIVARQGSEVLYAGTIAPGLPVVLRRDLVVGDGDAPVVDVEWAPAVAARSDGAVGVVGGVPGGVAGGAPGGVVGGVTASDPERLRSTFREGATGPAPAPAIARPQEPPRERLQIRLQRKNP